MNHRQLSFILTFATFTGLDLERAAKEWIGQYGEIFRKLNAQ